MKFSKSVCVPKTYGTCDQSQCVSCPCIDAVSISSGHYKLIGVDVRKEQEVEAALSAAGLQWDTPTLVLSEVVLTYMETQW